MPDIGNSQVRHAAMGRDGSLQTQQISSTPSSPSTRPSSSSSHSTTATNITNITTPSASTYRHSYTTKNILSPTDDYHMRRSILTARIESLAKARTPRSDPVPPNARQQRAIRLQRHHNARVERMAKRRLRELRAEAIATNTIHLTLGACRISHEKLTPNEVRAMIARDNNDNGIDNDAATAATYPRRLDAARSSFLRKCARELEDGVVEFADEEVVADGRCAAQMTHLEWLLEKARALAEEGMFRFVDGAVAGDEGRFAKTMMGQRVEGKLRAVWVDDLGKDAKDFPTL